MLLRCRSGVCVLHAFWAALTFSLILWCVLFAITLYLADVVLLKADFKGVMNKSPHTTSTSPPTSASASAPARGIFSDVDSAVLHRALQPALLSSVDVSTYVGSGGDGVPPFAVVFGSTSMGLSQHLMAAVMGGGSDTTNPSKESVMGADAVVVGAGAAGLAAIHTLTQHGPSSSVEHLQDMLNHTTINTTSSSSSSLSLLLSSNVMGYFHRWKLAEYSLIALTAPVLMSAIATHSSSSSSSSSVCNATSLKELLPKHLGISSGNSGGDRMESVEHYVCNNHKGVPSSLSTTHQQSCQRGYLLDFQSLPTHAARIGAGQGITLATHRLCRLVLSGGGSDVVADAAASSTSGLVLFTVIELCVTSMIYTGISLVEVFVHTSITAASHVRAMLFLATNYANNHTSNNDDSIPSGTTHQWWYTITLDAPMPTPEKFHDNDDDIPSTTTTTSSTTTYKTAPQYVFTSASPTPPPSTTQHHITWVLLPPSLQWLLAATYYCVYQHWVLSLPTTTYSTIPILFIGGDSRSSSVHPVLGVEGRDRVGGRAHTTHMGDQSNTLNTNDTSSSSSSPHQMVDLGATFLHFRSFTHHNHTSGLDEKIAMFNPIYELSLLHTTNTNTNNVASRVNYTRCEYYDRDGMNLFPTPPLSSSQCTITKADMIEVFTEKVYDTTHDIITAMRSRQGHHQQHNPDTATSSEVESLTTLEDILRSEELHIEEELAKWWAYDDDICLQRTSANDTNLQQSHHQRLMTAFDLLCFQHLVQDLQSEVSEISALRYANDALMGPGQDLDFTPPNGMGMGGLLHLLFPTSMCSLSPSRLQASKCFPQSSTHHESSTLSLLPKVAVSAAVNSIYYSCDHCGRISDGIIDWVGGNPFIMVDVAQLADNEMSGVLGLWWEPVDALLTSIFDSPLSTAVLSMITRALGGMMMVLTGIAKDIATEHNHRLPISLGINSYNPSGNVGEGGNGGTTTASTLSARRIILTLPIGVLKHSLSSRGSPTAGSSSDTDSDDIHFNPPLPQYVQTVVENLGVTIPMKIAMCWGGGNTPSAFDLDTWLIGAYNNNNPTATNRQQQQLQLPPSWFLTGGRGAATTTPTTTPRAGSNDIDDEVNAILIDLYGWERRTFGGIATQPPQQQKHRLGLGRGPHIEVLHWDTLTSAGSPFHDSNTGGKDRCLVLGVEGALAKEFTRLQQQSTSNTIRAAGRVAAQRGSSNKHSPSLPTTFPPPPLPPPLQAIVNYLLTELGGANTTLPQPTHVQFSKWGSPFSRGGYAHLRAGYGDDEDSNNNNVGGGYGGGDILLQKTPSRLQPWHSQQQHQLSEFSLDDRVYLAGEHTSADSFGSVQGAAETGMAAAMRVIHDSRIEVIVNEITTWCIVAVAITFTSLFVLCMVTSVYHRMLLLLRKH